LLDLVQHAVRRQSFDGGDLLADGFAGQHAAGSRGNAIDVKGTGAALGDAAAIFGAGQADVLPNRLQQRRVHVRVDFECLSVNREARHLVFPYV
jgi:hypothetical protein